MTEIIKKTKSNLDESRKKQWSLAFYDKQLRKFFSNVISKYLLNKREKHAMKAEGNLFYAINIMTIIYAFFIISVFFISSSSVYRELLNKKTIVEQEYNRTIELYKNTITFILKNRLIKTREYYNAFTGMIYKLPLAKTLEIYNVNNKEAGEQEKTRRKEDKRVVIISKCYESSCVKISVDKEKILGKILKETFGVNSIVSKMPLNNFSLLINSAKSFFEAHKSFVLLNFLFLFILYIMQSPFLIVKNIRISKANIALSKKIADMQNNIAKLEDSQKNSGESILYLQDQIARYFTQQAYNLVERELYIKNVDIIKILYDVDRFFKYQTQKKEITLIIKYNSPAIIKADEELVYVALMNFIYTAIYRAVNSSVIIIKIIQKEDKINIEISNTGYKFVKPTEEKILIYDLPKLLLENICKRIGLVFTEKNEKEGDKIYIKIETYFKNERAVREQQNGKLIMLKTAGRGRAGETRN